MKKIDKTNKILSIIALVLFLITAFDYGVMRFINKNNKEFLLFANLDANKIENIEIYSPGNDILTLEKIHDKDGSNYSWRIKNINYFADKNVSDNLIKTIQELKSSETVSSNANNLSKYGLDDINATNVKLKNGEDVIAELLIGSKGFGFNSQFVRLPDQNKVYLISSNLEDQFKKQIDDFRDKTIVNKEATEIQKVLIAGIEIKDEGIKDEFAPFNASGFIDAGENTDEAETQPIEAFDIQIFIKDITEPITVKIGKITKSNNYLVTVDTVPGQMFTVSKYLIDEFYKYLQDAKAQEIVTAPVSEG